MEPALIDFLAVPSPEESKVSALDAVVREKEAVVGETADDGRREPAVRRRGSSRREGEEDVVLTAASLALEAPPPRRPGGASREVSGAGRQFKADDGRSWGKLLGLVGGEAP